MGSKIKPIEDISFQKISSQKVRRESGRVGLGQERRRLHGAAKLPGIRQFGHRCSCQASFKVVETKPRGKHVDIDFSTY